MNKPIEVQVYELLKKHNLTLSTAESATGGMISSMLVNVPGISEFFQEGYVTYSNNAKVKMIGVDQTLIDKFGVVSKEVAENMVSSVAKTANTDAALSVTGVAGPDGGTEEKPVGTVFVGLRYNDETYCVRLQIRNVNRQYIRNYTVLHMLDLINKTVK